MQIRTREAMEGSKPNVLGRNILGSAHSPLGVLGVADRADRESSSPWKKDSGAPQGLRCHMGSRLNFSYRQVRFHNPGHVFRTRLLYACICSSSNALARGSNTHVQQNGPNNH